MPTDTHRYHSTIRWDGSTIVGYEAYDRTHHASAPPVMHELSLSADPTFGGDPSRLNPEQLLVLAASSCQLLSFLAVAARARLDVVGYLDEAEGEMPHRTHDRDAGEPVRMSIERIVLRPQIRIRGTSSVARVDRLVRVAHDECFIANSLRTEIVVDATITFEA